MDYVNPKELMREAITVAGDKASLCIGDMLIRGALSGVFLGFATSLAVVVTARFVQPIAGAILFPVGFVMLALLGLELATAGTVSRRHPLQLDGHNRRIDGPGFPLDGGEGGCDVAAYHDLLRAGLRTLDRQHVRGPSRNDVRGSGHDSKLAVMGSVAGHAGQHSLGSALHRNRIVRNLSR